MVAEISSSMNAFKGGMMVRWVVVVMMMRDNK
jgi:hypothetical protein